MRSATNPSLPGTGSPNRVRGPAASTRAHASEGSGRWQDAARGLQCQLGRIKAPMAADPPGPGNSASGGGPRECLRVYAQMLGSFVGGEETVVGLALVQQRAQLLTRAWVRAQLVENRQDQCLRYSRLSAARAHRCSKRLPVGATGREAVLRC